MYVSDLAAAAQPHASQSARALHVRLTGMQVSAASWDHQDDLWVAGSIHGRPAVRMLPGSGGAPVIVTLPPGIQQITAFRVAPDGVRVALIVSTRAGPRVLLAAVVHSGDQVTLASAGQLGADLTQPSVAELVRRRPPAGRGPGGRRAAAVRGAGQRRPVHVPEHRAGDDLDHRGRPAQRPVRQLVRPASWPGRSASASCGARRWPAGTRPTRASCICPGTTPGSAFRAGLPPDPRIAAARRRTAALSARLSRFLPVRHLPRCRDVGKKTVRAPDNLAPGRLASSYGTRPGPWLRRAGYPGSGVPGLASRCQPQAKRPT